MGGPSEVRGSHHHGGGAQGVAGPSEVVPLDAVELADVVADRVVNPVEVGETAGVEPPTWGRQRDGGGQKGEEEKKKQKGEVTEYTGRLENIRQTLRQ